MTWPETRSRALSKGANDTEKPFIKILRHLSQVTCALAIVAIAVNGASADTPASQVSVQTVQPTQSYPVVSANGEGWFDVGGFCKVVDVGDLSAMSPPATGVPVFVPGPTNQWENYRTSAPSDSNYSGKLTLTTCCRPQTGIAKLCTEAGATPVSVSRQYGKVGEVDTVSATCTDKWGKQFQDQINVACLVSGGGPDSPDAQGVWAETGEDATSGCTANAYVSACTASCGGGTQQTFDSCGNVTATTACNTQACCTPSYSYACNGASYVRTDNTCRTGSVQVGTCTLQSQTTNYGCTVSYSGGYYAGPTCVENYMQCSVYNWNAGASGTCVESGPGCFPPEFVGTGCPAPTGETCPINAESCTNTYWAPP